MGKRLTGKAIQQFHERGYYLPLDIASVEEIQEMRRQLEAFEAKSGSAFAVLTGLKIICFLSGCQT